MGAKFSSMTMENLPLPSALTEDLDSFLKQAVVERLSRAVPRAATGNFFIGRGVFTERGKPTEERRPIVVEFTVCTTK